MNPSELAELLRLGEDQTIELKTNCRVDTVGREVCAFLNTSGGYVICGVDDGGEIVGSSPAGGIPGFERKLAEGLSPKALASVELHEVEGKQVIVVEVPAGMDVPYAFRDQIYIREAARTVKADIDTIRDMVLRRQTEPERWERRFSTASIDGDLDGDALSAVVAAVNDNARMVFRNEGDKQAVLQDLDVVKYGRLTNGGDALFTSEPEARHPQLRVRAVCFTTDETDATYRDMKSFSGPLVSVQREVYRFVLRNTASRARFVEGEQDRRNEPLYPADAIDEGLVNAFAHRDYADYKGGIAVHIYPRRLEIRNSGGLPEGVTVEKLAEGHISVLRNPDIAHVLYLHGMMEKVGRGSLLIRDLCAKHGIPAPEWKSDPALGVTLTFYAPEGSALTGEVTEEVTEEATEEVTGGVTGEVTEEVTEQVRQLVATCAQPMKRVEIQAALELSHEGHFREAYLDPALELGLIERTIPEKPRSPKQKYRLTARGKELFRSLRSGADSDEGASR